MIAECDSSSIKESTALIAASPELLNALDLLYGSFVHIPGNVKGNKAKTDIIKYNDDVRIALNAARQAIDKARRQP